MTCPTLAGFIVFIRQFMQIPEAALPESAPVINLAFCEARAIVNRQLQIASPLMYTQAVYNLAGDILVNIAPDQQQGNYFACLRKELGLANFAPGVVSASSDESTSTTLLVPDFMKDLMLSDLQNLKTPWGRAYLAIAQKVGSLWGLS